VAQYFGISDFDIRISGLSGLGFQDFSRKELTLVTCTPLGTYWKRFIVRAELVN